MQRRTFIKNGMVYATAGIAAPSLMGFKNNASQENLKASSNMLLDLSGNQYQSVSTTVQLKGQPVKVHGFSTGTVAVKIAFRTKRGVGELAKLNILLDKHFTNYLPIWVWLIEHPEGLILIDTGENTAILDVDKYLANEKWIHRYPFKHAAKFSIAAEDEINNQFNKLNLKTEDVRLIILTHLHLDHTDGLKFFPKAEIIVGEHEWKFPNSNMPTTYPSWFKPNMVSYQENRVNIFNHAFPITRHEDLLYVPTPGHTHGHSSVLFKTDDFDILFAGDSSYNQQQVLNNELAGVNADFSKSADTYRKILAYADSRKTIYLPTHDEQSGARLASKSFIL